MDSTEAAKLLNQSLGTLAAQEALMMARKTIYYVYIEDFWYLSETHKHQGGKILAEIVALLLCDSL